MCVCNSQYIIRKLFLFLKDDSFSDGELALRRGGTLQVTTAGHKKFARKRNKVHTQCNG